MREVRVDAASVGRAGLAAGAAVAGVLLAVSIGKPVFILAFEHIGRPLADEFTWGGQQEDPSGVLALLTRLVSSGARFTVALMISIAVTAPIFMLVPMIRMAVVLRQVKAGLVVSTLWLSLAIVLALGALVQLLPLPVNQNDDWALVIAVVATGVFLGRLVAEFWKPEKVVSLDGFTPGSRRLTLTWSCVVVLIVGLAALSACESPSQGVESDVVLVTEGAYMPSHTLPASGQ